MFEVVDRRAKLVVNELADEQLDSQPPASNVQEHRGRGNRTQAQRRKSTADIPKLATTDPAHSNAEKPLPISATVNRSQPSETESYTEVSKSTDDPSPSGVDNVTDPKGNLTEIQENANSGGIYDGVTEIIVAEEKDGPLVSSTSGDESIKKSTDDMHRDSFPSAQNDESTAGINSSDVSSHVTEANGDALLSVDENEAVGSEKADSSIPNSTISINDDGEMKVELTPSKIHVQENSEQSLKIQDQLDEAQGLLKTAVSTGQSKEARLARVCAGLSSRLQEYKSENTQLEELLVAERELSSLYQAQIRQLQKDLSLRKTEVARSETNMADALAAKNSEIEALMSSIDALKKQASASDEKLASLQENMDAVLRSREITETRMMQALREELAVAERRAEEERNAHNATKMAAVEREVELEHRAVEASNALARIQRSADESTSRAMELEHKVALLEVECASLTQELQEMEARARRGQKKSFEEANQILQIQAWQEEVERARRSQRDAESKLSSVEAEMQKMRVEMAGMKRDAEHYSRHEHVELEKRYRELTDLLYHKQTQLEAMASEKAAATFQLEKEVRRFQEAQVEAERNRVPRRASASWEEDTDLKALEPLPLHHRHMAAASVQLQKAVKILDSGAVRATRFLWRYPYARVVLLFYLVFVHLFLMYLLHRLQEQADTLSSNEVALSMGLNNSSLP